MYAFDLDEDELRKRFVEPYQAGGTITDRGRSIDAADISEIRITRVDGLVGPRWTLAEAREKWQRGGRWRTQVGDYIADRALDVTNDFLPAPPPTRSSSKEPTGEPGKDAASPSHSDQTGLWTFTAAAGGAALLILAALGIATGPVVIALVVVVALSGAITKTTPKDATLGRQAVSFLAIALVVAVAVLLGIVFKPESKAPSAPRPMDGHSESRVK